MAWKKVVTESASGKIAEEAATAILATTATNVADNLALGGTPTAATATLGTNTTQLATTAFAVAQAQAGDTTLTSGNIWIGSALNAKAELALSGDVTMDNAGVVTIGAEKINSDHYVDGSIDNAHLADDAVNSDELAAGAVDTDHITDDQVTYAKMQNMVKDERLLGNIAGDDSVITELDQAAILTFLGGVEAGATADQSATEIAAMALTGYTVATGADNVAATDSIHEAFGILEYRVALNDLKATDTTYTHPNHSGDVTSVADGALTIADDKVTYAKMQNCVSDERLLGNVAGDDRGFVELDQSTVLTFLGIEAGSTADQTADEMGALFAADNTAVTFGGAVTVTGDLTVSGTTTTVNTATLTVEDNIITLNSGALSPGDPATTADIDAGIEVERGARTNTWINWDEGKHYWTQHTQKNSDDDSDGADGMIPMVESGTSTSGSASAVGNFYVKTDTSDLYVNV